MEVDFLDVDDHDGSGGFAVDGEGFHEGRVGGEVGAAVDAHGVADAGDEGHQGDPGVADDVAEAVDAVVAAAVGQHEGAVVVDADEAGLVAAGGAVEAFGADGGQGGEGGGFEVSAVVRGDVVGDLGGGGFADGAVIAVDFF